MTARRRSLAFGRASGRSASSFVFGGPKAWGIGSFGGLEAREGKEDLNKAPFLLPCCTFGGKKKGEQCRSKRHRSALLFLFFFSFMKRRRFGENVPFHLNVAPECAKFQISPQLSFVHFNCRPANFGPRPHSWPRFSLCSLASDLCN